MAGHQGQHGGYSRDHRRESRYMREHQRRDEISYKPSWDENRYSRREPRHLRPRSEPPRYRYGYNPYPVGRMRTPVPVSRPVPAKETGYGGQRTRSNFQRDVIRPSTNRSETSVAVPSNYSHRNSATGSHASKGSFTNSSVVSRTRQKEEWERLSRPREKSVRSSSQWQSDTATSRRTQHVGVKQKSRPGGGLPSSKERMQRPIVTTLPSVAPVKVSVKAGTGKSESPDQPKVEQTASKSSASPKIEKPSVTTSLKADNKAKEEDPGEKQPGTNLSQSSRTPSATSKPETQDSTKEPSNDKLDEKLKPSDVGAKSEKPKEHAPLRPNFGKSIGIKTNEDDFSETMFNCPTSPLIHMSESCVPLIQRALKSAAPTIDHQNGLGRYSPDMSMSGDEANTSHRNNERKDAWASARHAEPLQPNFTQSSQKTADGQRKAVRRPKRRSDFPSEKVEYLFPPTSPIPALNMQSQRSSNSSSIKQPPVGARPLVLLDSISRSPSKPDGRFKQGGSNSVKSKSATQSYVHLSELQQQIDNSKTGEDKLIPGSSKKPVAESEKKSVPSSITGGLESALRTLEKESSTENSKSLKRKLSGSSKQNEKRFKVSEQEFKVNPVALDLFGSLPNSTSRSNDTSKTNLTSSLFNDEQAKVALSNLSRELEKLPQGDSRTVTNSKHDPPSRSNNGVVFLIDGVTAGSCISVFKKKKALAECFVTKKVRQKKKSSSECVSYHVHPSVGHQLTYFCARHVARWKMPPAASIDDESGRTEHKVFVITKDPRFSMLMKSLKADGVDVALVKDLSNLRTLLDSLVK